MEQPLEHAIWADLQVPRTQAARIPKDYVPPYPAYCARFPKSIDNLVMAIIGAQSKPNASLELSDISIVLDFIKKSSVGAAAPAFWDIASGYDHAKTHNLSVIAYWPSRVAYNEWSRSSGFATWWQQLQPEHVTQGWFLEVFFPAIDSFETVFSDNIVPEGAARMREGVSGPVQEHVYWGSMRDRMPLSQTEPLDGDPWTTQEAAGTVDTQESITEAKRIKVSGRRNLCVIRSGQDWSATYPLEREKYLETMHPVLIRGMEFLRDEGVSIGCFQCRFMQVHDDGKSLDNSSDRTFGLAYFNDMLALEKWSKEHKTHLDIFGRFLQYAQELENNVSLRLFHEVLVLQPDQQLFEYIACYPGTGMLSAK